MKILVTGSAGFIGFSVAKKLLDLGYNVIGVDNLNDYYDVELKNRRNIILEQYNSFKFYKYDISDFDALKTVFTVNNDIRKVIHLAAQAGVRKSISYPFLYEKVNIQGFINLVEISKNSYVERIVYASSSSVYGNSNKKTNEKDCTDFPLSVYAVTKKTNELLANVYNKIYGISFVGLRLFTVYGPWGRPDMAYYIFTKQLMEGKDIPLFNYGNSLRSFTFIDDVVTAVVMMLDKKFNCEIFNIGNEHTIKLIDFVKILENITQRKAKINLLEKQPGDVDETWADITKLKNEMNYRTSVSIDEGLRKFVDWFREYYRLI